MKKGLLLILVALVSLFFVAPNNKEVKAADVTFEKITSSDQLENGKYLIVFIGQEANGSYPIVISGSKDNGQNGNLILRGLNEKFTTSGGGRPDFVNGIIKSNDKVAILEEIKKLVK